MENNFFSSLHRRTIVISAVTSFVVWMLLTFLQPRFPSSMSPSAKSESATSTLQVPSAALPSPLSSEDEAVIALVRRAQPAVVSVVVKSSVAPRTIEFFDPFFAPFFETPKPRGSEKPRKQAVGGGSGFFVSGDGIIATNRHVVDFEAAEFEITTNTGKTYPAKILGMDPILDIAFLRVDGKGFPVLEFDDSDTLTPGQTVVAIGNALGEFRNSVTKGVVSGLNRRLIAGDRTGSELIEEAIQTDAAINPGNSGGPLLNLSGKVVGLNTAIASNGQLVGFALPSNTVRRDLTSLQKQGRITRPFLGVRYVMITEDLVKKNQLPVDFGALILRGQNLNELAVAPGSPADKAGIVEQDILLEVNGVRITEDQSLASLIGRHAPGETITLKLLHAGSERTVSVTLVEMKDLK